jgi:hypothetical protein
MKNTAITILLLVFSFNFSQVAIGKATVSSPSVSLEFANGNRGLILPWVTDAASLAGAANGTFIFDTLDQKVKCRIAGSWFDFSNDITGFADISLQSLKIEYPGAKVGLGMNVASNILDTAPGILVLTDTDKAMILPKVANPHLNIVNPAPGMIVYDTTAHQLAVFNGSVWSFWKPQ